MKDRGLFLFTILIKYGWLFALGTTNILYHIFNTPHQDMFTRGVIALIGFNILIKLEQMDWMKEKELED